MKLNEAQINSISDEYIMLMDANGNPLKIAKTDLANALAPYVPATKSEVWIVYLDSSKNRVLVPWEEWSISQTDAVGVAIMSGGRRLLIAPHEPTLYWSSTVGLVERLQRHPRWPLTQIIPVKITPVKL